MANKFQIKTLSPSTIERVPWFRNPSWPALPTIVSTDSKIAGVVAIYNTGGSDSNVVTLYCTGAFTVNWGDGNIVNYATGTTASHTYDYNNVSLTDSAVTFQTTANTVTRATHNYSDGMPISFSSIVTTTGIIANVNYYVINSTLNTFQLAITPGGSPISLVNDGTGSILSYKTAVIIVTPQPANNFTIVDFTSTVTGGGTQTLWLDIAISAPYMTNLYMNTRFTGRMHLLEQVSIINGGTAPLNNGLWSTCHRLKSIPIINSASVSTYSYLFSEIYSLEYVGTIKTAVAPTDLTGMFYNCNSLRNAPIIDTSQCTIFDYMFGTLIKELQLPNI